MTGPVARVACPQCGRLLARRRDGTPYAHGCDVKASSPAPVLIALPLSDFEQTVIDELRRRGGFATLDEAVLTGLWQLARQLDVDVPVGTFGIRKR